MKVKGGCNLCFVHVTPIQACHIVALATSIHNVQCEPLNFEGNNSGWVYSSAL